jgi:hypothetical protein
MIFSDFSTAGKISQTEFEESLQKFVAISSRLRDDWKIVADQVTPQKWVTPQKFVKSHSKSEFLYVQIHLLYVCLL